MCSASIGPADGSTAKPGRPVSRPRRRRKMPGRQAAHVCSCNDPGTEAGIVLDRSRSLAYRMRGSCSHWWNGGGEMPL
jgi:hypothetical protein